MNWITENWQELVGIVSGTIGVLVAICKLTPSPKDDTVMAKVVSWLKLVPTKKPTNEK